MFNKKR